MCLKLLPLFWKLLLSSSFSLSKSSLSTRDGYDKDDDEWEHFQKKSNDSISLAASLSSSSCKMHHHILLTEECKNQVNSSFSKPKKEETKKIPRKKLSQCGKITNQIRKKLASSSKLFNKINFKCVFFVRTFPPHFGSEMKSPKNSFHSCVVFFKQKTIDWFTIRWQLKI